MGSMARGQRSDRQSPSALKRVLTERALTAPKPAGSLQPALLRIRIREIADLPANWDGAGAVAPSAVAIAQACVLIDAVAQMEDERTGGRRSPFTSAPIADGGLQAEWMGDNARIDVQIAPDGTLGYMTKQGHGLQAVYDEQDGVPVAILLDVIEAVLTLEPVHSRTK